jgi:hypothetical protein
MMHAATRTSPRWWQGRRLRLFLLLGVLAVLLIRVGLDLWAGGRVRAETSRLEAKYGTLDPGAGWPPEVPAADNRARLVKAAAVLVVAGQGASAMPMSRALSEFKALPGNPRVPDDLRKFATVNREPLQLVDEARAGFSLLRWLTRAASIKQASASTRPKPASSRQRKS